MAQTTISADICKGCGLCVNTCPKKIIYLDEATLNHKGYHPAAITEMDACIGCAMCAMMCPDSAITITKP